MKKAEQSETTKSRSKQPVNRYGRSRIGNPDNKYERMKKRFSKFVFDSDE